MKEYRFYFFDTELKDIVSLKKMLQQAGCETKFESLESTSNDEFIEMGLKEVLTAVVTAVKAFRDTLKIWFTYKKTKIVIIEKDGMLERKYEVDTSNPDDVKKLLEAIREYQVN